ncbi:MAG: regulatory protein GemA [Sphingomonas sp.]
MRPAGKPAAFDAGSQHRHSLIGKVHVAKKALGLDDDLYRGVLFDVAGQRSAADCTDSQLIAVVKHFESRGFSAKAKSGAPKPADNPMARKARAMWISLHQLGAIDNPSEPALEAFACRQLGCEKLQWANQALAYRLIEALKAIGERHGWRQALDGVRPDATVTVLKRRLVEAILGKLWKAGLAPATWDVNRAAFEFAGLEIDLLFVGASDLDLVAAAFGRALRGAVK